MSLSSEERQIVEYGKAQGKTSDEVVAAISQYRNEQSLKPTEEEQKPGLFSDQGPIVKGAKAVTHFLGGDKVAETFGAEAAKLVAKPEEKQFITQPSVKETLGSALELGSTFIGGGAGAEAKLAARAGIGLGAGYAHDIGQNLQDGKEGTDALQITPMTAVIGSLDAVGGPAAGEAGKIAGKGAKAAGEAVTDAAKAIAENPHLKGVVQAGTELAERVPRFLSRKSVQIRDAATRAERIATAPEPIANAIKAGVPEPVINTIEQADAPTRKGYHDIVRLAEESVSTTGTLKQKVRPEIVAGDAAANQFKMIDDQRRAVGKELGAEVKRLSENNTQHPMQPAYDQLHQALEEAKIGLKETEGKVALDFSKSGYTKAQRSKIQELYDLATEGGDTLTAEQIHGKDRLFSQLQREARMEGIGDIVVDTANGPMSLFSAFRDVYSNTLEEIAPEIKPLNSRYRNLRTFVDDIESTIIKTGKYETNKNADPAEFAQTNLRRLFSDASSAADYRAIAEEMDKASRALGYSGAKPEDLARFAYELRKIYPDTVPETGFTGSMKSGLMGFAGHMLEAGKADVTDQQKALRALIDSMQEQ